MNSIAFKLKGKLLLVTRNMFCFFAKDYEKKQRKILSVIFQWIWAGSKRLTYDVHVHVYVSTSDKILYVCNTVDFGVNKLYWTCKLLPTSSFWLWHCIWKPCASSNRGSATDCGSTGKRRDWTGVPSMLATSTPNCCVRQRPTKACAGDDHKKHVQLTALIRTVMLIRHFNFLLKFNNDRSWKCCF